MASVERSSLWINLCVVGYLMAAVIANLAVYHFGPSALPFTAFFLVGVDLGSRDYLHERWKGSFLLPRLGLLIASGSLLSYLAVPGAGLIAVASFAAFLSSGIVNTLFYHALSNQRLILRMNVSNLFAAINDSIVFPLIAFGGIYFDVALSQAGAKFLGGLLWSFLFATLLGRSNVSHQQEVRV